MNDGSHSQNVQHGQPTQKPLSCTNCRQRKVKCDRMTPCLHCRMSERQCIYPSRVRVRRSHQAVESCNKELYDRIRHLEKLVSEIGASASSGINCDHGSMEAVAESPIQTPAPVPAEDYFITQRDHLDDQGLAIVRQQETGSRVLGHTFWMSLSQEVGGLRKLLDETADSEDVPYSDASDTADTKSSPILLFNDLPILFQPEDPPKFQCSILARHYFSNIHPICKILHGPTIAAYLEVGTQSFNDGEAPSQSNGVKAITFAIYFAAVTSMSAVDCEKYLRAEKGAMIRWYKQNAEAALARAELLHSVDIATLQAFVLYIMTIRSHDASQSSWSLIGLAVRIAHALGLHRDGDGKAFTPFHAEMRRRLWWEILVLDGRASEDRGTESMILDGSFNTIMPHNLNDEDFNMTIRALPPSKVGITEMTFCLICMDVCNTILKISFIPPFKEHHVLTFQQKEELVKACAGRIDSYLAGSSPSDPNTWMVCSVGQLLVLRLWLVLQYPLQSVHSSSQHFARGQSLRTATAYMKLAEALEVADASACFVWFFKTYVPWHALAVALAELCNETQGPLADDAWDIIAKGYDKWVERMADSKGGMLWRPVKSLMKKARAARERGQELAEPRSGSFQSAPEQTLSGGNIQIDPLAPTIDQSHSLDPHYFSSSDLAPQTMYSSFGLDFLNLADYIAPASTGHLEDLPDWNLWDQFVSDVGEPCGDSHILPFS